MTFSFAISHEILSQQVFVFLAVFARLGAMIMTMPAIGAESVPPNVRLVLALVLTFTIVGLVTGGYPVLPETLFGLISFLIAEIIIGLIIGGILRMVMSAVQVAGSLIAFQSSLAFAQNFDPTQGVQGALIGTFLSLAAVTIFVWSTRLKPAATARARTAWRTLMKPCRCARRMML